MQIIRLLFVLPFLGYAGYMNEVLKPSLPGIHRAALFLLFIYGSYCLTLKFGNFIEGRRG